MLRALREDEVEFVIVAWQEGSPVRGNVCDSGDKVFDKKVEDEIIARLNSGSVWAWARVEVRAQWKNHMASEYLGGCSYKDEEDFKKDAYYIDMKNGALELLNKALQDAYASLKELEIKDG